MGNPAESSSNHRIRKKKGKRGGEDRKVRSTLDDSIRVSSRPLLPHRPCGGGKGGREREGTRTASLIPTIVTPFSNTSLTRGGGGGKKGEKIRRKESRRPSVWSELTEYGDVINAVISRPLFSPGAQLGRRGEKGKEERKVRRGAYSSISSHLLLPEPASVYRASIGQGR